MLDAATWLALHPGPILAAAVALLAAGFYRATRRPADPGPPPLVLRHDIGPGVALYRHADGTLVIPPTAVITPTANGIEILDHDRVLIVTPNQPAYYQPLAAYTAGMAA